MTHFMAQDAGQLALGPELFKARGGDKVLRLLDWRAGGDYRTNDKSLENRVEDSGAGLARAILLPLASRVCIN